MKLFPISRVTKSSRFLLNLLPVRHIQRLSHGFWFWGNGARWPLLGFIWAHFFLPLPIPLPQFPIPLTLPTPPPILYCSILQNTRIAARHKPPPRGIVPYLLYFLGAMEPASSLRRTSSSAATVRDGRIQISGCESAAYNCATV